MLRKLEIRLHTDKTQINHLTKSASRPSKWYGSYYGGFYVDPSLLDSQSIVYSFGIGKDISFDETLVKNHGCTVYGFDPTPKSINWLKNLKRSPFLRFYEYGISDKQSTWEYFYLPKNQKGTSGSLINHIDTNRENYIKVLVKSFDEIASDLGHRHVDLVKMDIEGAEYAVLMSILESPVTINQILIEFHDRYFDVSEFRSKEIVKKMNRHGYYIFAHSMSYEEVSFVHDRKLT